MKPPPHPRQPVAGEQSGGPGGLRWAPAPERSTVRGTARMREGEHEVRADEDEERENDGWI